MWLILRVCRLYPNDDLNLSLNITVQATEEAIINSMLAAETMTGADDLRVSALSHKQLAQLLKKYNRLNMRLERRRNLRFTTSTNSPLKSASNVGSNKRYL